MSLTSILSQAIPVVIDLVNPKNRKKKTGAALATVGIGGITAVETAIDSLSQVLDPETMLYVRAGADTILALVTIYGLIASTTSNPSKTLSERIKEKES